MPKWGWQPRRSRTSLSRVSFFRRANESRGARDLTSYPVLVVEDDAGLRAYLATILEGQGYTVIAAGSGEEALEALGNRKAMLAVLDIGLPGMDGFAVAEHLDNDVPVIVVTGDPLKAKMRLEDGSKRIASGLIPVLLTFPKVDKVLRSNTMREVSFPQLI